MKKAVLVIFLLSIRVAIFACGVCEKQQPKILQGITHGAGPESNWDYLIISIAAAIVVFTFYLSVKWLIRPGETAVTHIKYLTVNND